jgi:hypothetical protein
MKLGNSKFDKSDKNSIDYKVEFKSIITNFVTTQCTGTDDLLVKFLHFVSRNYEINIENFIKQHNLKQNDIVFIYKGGNVLRMILLKYLNNFPGTIKDFFLEQYKDILGKSDADFQIYVNKNITNYDYIHSEVQKLSLTILMKLRDEFIKSISSYFQFSQTNESQQKIILQQYLEKLNLTAEIKNPLSPYFNIQFIALELLGSVVGTPKQTNITKKEDFLITPTSGGTLTYQIINPLYPNGCDIYASLNQKIESHLGKNHVDFALSRIKLNSVATYKIGNDIKTMSIPGELVDVSIPYRDDSIAEKFDVEKSTKLYKLADSKNNLTNIRAYSRKYVMHDLIEILFKVAKYPWLDKKYKKRLNRLSIFCFISDIHKFPILTVHNILDMLFQILSKVNNMPPLETLEYIKNILPQISNSLNNIQTIRFVVRPSNFTLIFDEMTGILNALNAEKNSTDIEEFKKYLLNILETVNFFLECVGKIRYYLNAPFQEEEQQIVEVSQLGGTSKYYQKYLKYKKKYLNLKK